MRRKKILALVPPPSLGPVSTVTLPVGTTRDRAQKKSSRGSPKNAPSKKACKQRKTVLEHFRTRMHHSKKKSRIESDKLCYCSISRRRTVVRFPIWQKLSRRHRHRHSPILAEMPERINLISFFHSTLCAISSEWLQREGGGRGKGEMPKMKKRQFPAYSQTYLTQEASSK